MDVERTTTGDIKYPEDIWKAARPIASDYQQAMAISALILAERQRCANIAKEEGDKSRALYPIATQVAERAAGIAACDQIHDRIMKPEPKP